MSKQPAQGDAMAETKEMTVARRRSSPPRRRRRPGRYYIPYADIYETEEALAVVMEMPASRGALRRGAREDVLRVDGGSTSRNTRTWSPSTPKQRRPLCPLLHARARRGPGEDQREPRRRGADLDLAEGETRRAEEDRDRARGFPFFCLEEISMRRRALRRL